jgi:enediyne biosynthesis protein E4
MGCGGEDEPGKTEECTPVMASETGAAFIDATDQLGIDGQWHGEDFCTLQDQGGSGVCLIDYDGDDDLDIYFPDRGGYPNLFYRNDGGSFTEVGEEVGLRLEEDEAAGCLPFDYDGDGDLDMFVANNGADRLMRNDGGMFTDVSAEMGLESDTRYSMWASAGDIDLDGDLDLFVGSIGKPETCPQDRCVLNPAECEPEANRMLDNRGAAGFVDVAAERGMDHADYSTAGIFYDYDFDGDLDLYVGNDMAFFSPDRFYVNDGTGNFVDRSTELGLAAMGVSNMGADVGDYNQDGVVDLLLSDFDALPARLVSCPPEGECTDYPLADSLKYVKWGIGFVDFDHDRDLDVFVANGALREPTGNPNWLFHYDAGQFRLYAHGDDDALADAEVSRGVAFGDLDGDHDLDVVVANTLGGHQVLLNEQAAGHALIVKLDSLAAGAQVTAKTADHELTEHVRVGGMYSGARDPAVHFGLGDVCSAEVTVTYPGGATKDLGSVAADQVLVVER